MFHFISEQFNHVPILPGIAEHKILPSNVPTSMGGLAIMTSLSAKSLFRGSFYIRFLFSELNVLRMAERSVDHLKI